VRAGAPVTVKQSLREDGGLLHLVLDQPKGNVLSLAMMAELASALDAHRDAAGLRLVLLSGAGGSFSYGASIQEHRADRAAQLLGTFHSLVRRVAAFPVPVAALVEGNCLGAGFELALCCHFLFATPDARLAAPEIRLGVFPPVLAALGARRLGHSLAEQMLLTGEAITGEDAWRRGLVTALVGREGRLPEDEVLEWFRGMLAPLSAYSLSQATRVVRDASGTLHALGEPLDRAERQYLDALVKSHDGNEGVEAFLAKRPPIWSNS